MATKQYYHDIDQKSVSQLINSRTHNVTTATRTAIGAALTSANAGFHVFDTDLKQSFYWDGTQWTNGVPVSIPANFLSIAKWNID